MEVCDNNTMHSFLQKLNRYMCDKETSIEFKI